MSTDVIEQTATVGWPDFDAIGLSHRRFLYWVRFGYLRHIEGTHRGSGVRLQFDPAEIAVARWMLTLTTWGMELAAAADYARDPWLRRNLAEILLADATPTTPLSASATAAAGLGGAGVPSPAPPQTPARVDLPGGGLTGPG